MMAFDAPKRSVCLSRRERTDSPLQALILLNGVQYVEAARVLGEKLFLEAKGDVARMIEAGFLRCLSRRPDADADADADADVAFALINAAHKNHECPFK